MFTDQTANVVKSVNKNLPRVKNAVANGLNDSRSQRAVRKLCINLGIIAETLLKAKRDQRTLQNARRNAKASDPPPKLSAKVEKTVNAFLDVILKSEENVVEFLLCNLGEFPHETRHEISHIIKYINRCRRVEEDGKTTMDKFVASITTEDSKILPTMLRGFGNPEIGSKVFEMLEDMIRKEQIAAKILNTPELLDMLFAYMQSNSFEKASNAFDMLHTLLDKFHNVSQPFLLNSFDEFMVRYNTLLSSKEYITRRQALQLLAETIIHKSNRKFMMKFLGKREQLRIILSSLFWKTETVRFEAFNIFKLFVANPKKSDEVHDMLFREKEKLIKMLTNFHGLSREGADNTVFMKDKKHCLKKLGKLERRDPEAQARKTKEAEAKKRA